MTFASCCRSASNLRLRARFGKLAMASSNSGRRSLRRCRSRGRLQRHVHVVVTDSGQFEKCRPHRFVDFLRSYDRPRDLLVSFCVNRRFAHSQVDALFPRRRKRELEWFVHSLHLRKLLRVLDLNDESIGFSYRNPRRLRLRVDLEREHVRRRKSAFTNAEDGPSRIVAELELRSRARGNRRNQFLFIAQQHGRSFDRRCWRRGRRCCACACRRSGRRCFWCR